jgi:hypothetical protein
MKFLRRFDLNNAHFYAGMAMLFAGLWLTWSLGLALIVTGDFLRLHARQIKHRGIIYTHQKTPTKQIIQGLILIHQALTEEEMQDHIEFL